MRNGILFTILAALVLSHIACTPSRTIFLNEGYEKNSINSSFVVIPMKKEWAPDAVISPLSSDAKEYLYSALKATFSMNTNTSVNVIDNDTYYSYESFERKKIASDELSLEIILPPDSLLNSFPERYVYIFEGYGFREVEKTVSGSSYAGNETLTYSALLFQTEFYLLDKETKEIISWGTIGEETSFENEPQYNHYYEILSKVSKKIVSEGPFKVASPRP